jgi:hypothetical protein
MSDKPKGHEYKHKFVRQPKRHKYRHKLMSDNQNDMNTNISYY